MPVIRKAVSLPEDLAEEVDRWIAAQAVKPTLSAVIAAALRMFLDAQVRDARKKR